MSLSSALLTVALGFACTSAAEEPVPPDPLGIWRCEAQSEAGDTRVTWFNFALNGAQEWLVPGEGQQGSWSEAFSWRRDDGRLDWSSRAGGMHYRGRITGTMIEGAFFHDDTRAELAGDFRCERSEGGPAVGRNAESAELESPPVQARSHQPAKPKPTPKRMVAPAYPEQALLQEVEGRVIVCFTVDTAGRVFEPVVIESTNAVFNEPVLKALARSRYEPARDEGEAVMSHSCRIFKFWLN